MESEEKFFEYNHQGQNVDLEPTLRKLINERISEDREAIEAGLTPEVIDQLSPQELGMLPEASIAAIIITWKVLEDNDVPEPEIIKKITDYRSSLGVGPTFEGRSLLDFVKYRVNIEKPNNCSITDKYIEIVFHRLVKLFDKPKSRHKLDYDDEQLIIWLLQEHDDLSNIRRIYSQQIDQFVQINLKSIKQEIEGNNLFQPDKIIQRATFIASYYEDNLKAGVSAVGGLKLCDKDLQSACALMLIKISVMLNYAKIKFRVDIPEQLIQMVRAQ